MIQGGGVELNELHVLDSSLGSVNHGDTVSCSNHGIRGCLVDGANTTGRHKCCLGQESMYFPCPHVQNIGSVTLDVVRMSGHVLSQMVLSQDFDGKVLTVHMDIGVVLNPVDQRLLNFGTRGILVVQDTEIGV